MTRRDARSLSPDATQVGAAIVVLLLAFAAVMVAGVGSARSTSALRVFMSPSGTGSACTQAAPCASLPAAVAAAADGATITAAGGDYGDQTLKAPSRPQPLKNITITPATGATPVFGKTLISVPGLTFDGISFDDQVRMGASGTVTHSHVTGAGILVRGNDITITDTLIEGGYGHDGINIAGYPVPVHNIVVRHNTIRDIGQYTKDHPEHPDCIQLFDANHITIEQNTIYDCHNTGIIFSPGAGRGISDVLIRANFVQGCLPARQSCIDGGGALDQRQDPTNVTIINNTFGSGSVRLPYHAGVTATRNIIGYLSVANPCTTSATNSIIGSVPQGLDCTDRAPGATLTTSSGNVLGAVSFVNPNAGDLHVRDPAAVILRHIGARATTAGAGTDIDGQPLSSNTIGADQPGNAPAARSASPSTSPSHSSAVAGTSAQRSASASEAKSTAARDSMPTSIPAGGGPFGRGTGLGFLMVAVVVIAVVAVGLRVRRGRRERGS